MREHVGRLGRTGRRGWGLVAGSAALALSLAGCSADAHGSASTGWLPASADGGQITTETARVTDLWVGVWITALLVGLLVWGLTIYVMIRYRRRKTDTGLPAQLRYNVPIEILYTVVPIFMVAVIFYYTARDESALLDTSKKPDLTVNVVAKQWSWDFNYVDANTYEAGQQVHLDPKTGNPLVPQPVLYLPINKTVQFDLTARDVVHSFWVPAFLIKMDVVPGKVNKFQVTPTELGTFQGKCAELCGAYHSEMLFQVKVISQADFDAKMSSLKAAGNVGQLPNSLNREPLVSTDVNKIPEGVR